MAVTVLALAISGSVTVLAEGMRCINTARNTTLAGQILQSLMEDLRMQTWTQIAALEAASNNGTTGNVTIDASFTGYSTTAATVLSGFTVTRTISDAPSQAGMKIILLTVTWTGIDRRTRSLSYTSYYGQNGIYDYYIS